MFNHDLINIFIRPRVIKRRNNKFDKSQVSIIIVDISILGNDNVFVVINNFICGS